LCLEFSSFYCTDQTNHQSFYIKTLYCTNFLWIGGKIIGIKEYSDWPTIPQLYVNKEFVGGCDILMNMHQSGELADLFEKNNVLAPAEDESSSS